MIIIIILSGGCEDHGIYIYIYAFRFLENGYMNPTSIGATWVSNKNDGPPHHPPTVWPRSSDKPKVDLRSKSPRFNHGNHFFLQNNSFFFPSEFLDSVWFFGPTIHWPIRSCQKENPKPSTNYDLMLKRIWSLKIHGIFDLQINRNHG